MRVVLGSNQYKTILQQSEIIIICSRSEVVQTKLRSGSYTTEHTKLLHSSVIGNGNNSFVQLQVRGHIHLIYTYTYISGVLKKAFETLLFLAKKS